MKIYLAGPLFTKAEQDFNLKLYKLLTDKGFNVFLPQQECKDKIEKDIFLKCKEGLDLCDMVLAIMDGADADSGTCWECGYAFASKKPIIALRTDFRTSGDTGGFNAMIFYSAAKVIEGNDFESELIQYLISQKSSGKP
jgi:nucleoside 2-deoxyribosyltransferase